VWPLPVVPGPAWLPVLLVLVLAEVNVSIGPQDSTSASARLQRDREVLIGRGDRRAPAIREGRSFVSFVW
jgi:hypothetical protein